MSALWMVMVVVVGIGLRVVGDAQIERQLLLTFDLRDHATAGLIHLSFISYNSSVVYLVERSLVYTRDRSQSQVFNSRCLHYFLQYM